MPTIDKRNTVQNAHTGGTDVGIAVYLEEAEAQQIYGAAAVAGWYVFATFAGGSLGHEVDSEFDTDEAGQQTGKVIVNEDSWVIQNTIKESDDMTLDLIDKVLTQSAHKYRYALPLDVQKEFDMDGAGTMETHDAHQVYGLYNGTIAPGWTTPTEAGQMRTRDVEIRGSKKAPNPAYVRKTVYLGDQTTWQHADGDSLADFMDAVV